MTRHQANGTAKVRMGRILPSSYPTFERASELARKRDRFFPEYTHEVSGVAGRYQVIQRDIQPSPSRYISHK